MKVLCSWSSRNALQTQTLKYPRIPTKRDEFSLRPNREQYSKRTTAKVRTQAPRIVIVTQMHLSCQFDTHESNILDSSRTQRVQRPRCDAEGSCLRVRLNSNKASHIYVVSLLILRARSEGGSTRNCPWCRIAPLAPPELESVCDNRGNAVHILLVNRGSIWRRLDNLLALALLTF